MRPLPPLLVFFTILLLQLVMVDSYPIDLEHNLKPKRGRRHSPPSPDFPFWPQFRFIINSWQHMLLLFTAWILFNAYCKVKEWLESTTPVNNHNGTNGVHLPSSDSESSLLSLSASSVSSYYTFSSASPLPPELYDTVFATPPAAPAPRTNWDDELASIRRQLRRDHSGNAIPLTETAQDQQVNGELITGSDSGRQLSVPAVVRHPRREAERLDTSGSASFNGTAGVEGVISRSSGNGYATGWDENELGAYTNTEHPPTAVSDSSVTPDLTWSCTAAASQADNGMESGIAYNSPGKNKSQRFFFAVAKKGNSKRSVHFSSPLETHHWSAASELDSSNIVPRQTTTNGFSTSNGKTANSQPVVNHSAMNQPATAAEHSLPATVPVNVTSHGHIPPGEIVASRPAPRPRSGWHTRSASISSLEAVTVSPAIPDGARAGAPPSYDSVVAAEEDEFDVQRLAGSTICVVGTPTARRPTRLESIREPWSDLSMLPDLPDHDNLRDAFKDRTLRGRM